MWTDCQILHLKYDYFITCFILSLYHTATLSYFLIDFPFYSFVTASGFTPLSLGAIIGGSIGLVFLLILLASILIKKTEFKKRFPAIYTNYHTRNGVKIREKRDSIPDASSFSGMGLDKDLGSEISDMTSVEAVGNCTQSVKEVLAEEKEVQNTQQRLP